MADPAQTYRSLMLRKAQQLAKEHGGIARIPRRIQRKLGFDVISKRKGHVISVRIPAGDLSPRISELRAELPAAGAFGPSKPEPDALGRYTPVVSGDNPTMDDFWIMKGWYREDRFGIKLTRAKWQDEPDARTEAVRFLIEEVLKKDPRDTVREDFGSNRLGGLMKYFGHVHYEALVAAGYFYSADETLRHAGEGNFSKDKFYPWELSVTSSSSFSFRKKEHRIASIKWLIWEIGDPRKVHDKEFEWHGLGGLVHAHYKGSSFDALVEGEFAYPVWEALEHARTPDFKEDKIYPWELLSVPKDRFPYTRENSIAAVKWLLWKLGSPPPWDIISGDFELNGLGGLLQRRYLGSAYAALLEAGFVTPADEGYMRSNNHELSLRDSAGRFFRT